MIESIQKFAPCMALAMLCGCGGGSSSGSSGGGTPFKTSLSGSKMLNALTASEKTQLCADISTFFASVSVRTSECKLVGVLGAVELAALDDTSTDANLRAACTASYDSCVAQSVDAGADSVGSCDISKTVPATCSATIADYSACIGDYPQILGGSAPACSTLTRAILSSDAGVGTMTSGLPATSACNALVAKCPEVATITTALLAKPR